MTQNVRAHHIQYSSYAWSHVQYWQNFWVLSFCLGALVNWWNYPYAEAEGPVKRGRERERNIERAKSKRERESLDQRTVFWLKPDGWCISSSTSACSSCPLAVFSTISVELYELCRAAVLSTSCLHSPSVLSYLTLPPPQSENAGE